MQHVIFIKLGTESVWEPGWLEVTCRQIHTMHQQGYRVIVTSSGAIEAGARKLAHMEHLTPEAVRSRYTKQVLAGFGTTTLWNMWEDALAPHALIPIPLLVTHGNFAHQNEAYSIKTQIRQILDNKHGIVIANENDLVSGLEIEYWSSGLGENDKLQVALVMLAHTIPDVTISGVLFATHKGGFYTSNPDTDPSATLVRTIEWESCAYRDLIPIFMNPWISTTQIIPNNMIAKVCAGLVCAKYGDVPHVAIAQPHQLSHLMTASRHFVGTRITT